ncbi:hypothetical protein [Luteolibacter sp. AS25]|uniref:hypothetical protein n=1 Tax=Luteolibacter sp. AS25 TaxID=3135776 RepID=UPI00398B910C
MKIIAIATIVGSFAFLGTSCVDSRSAYGGPSGYKKKETGYNHAPQKHDYSKDKYKGNNGRDDHKGNDKDKGRNDNKGKDNNKGRNDDKGRDNDDRGRNDDRDQRSRN